MISTISLNFHRADLSVRSVLQYSREELTETYQSLTGRAGLHGILIISTCNRTEFYVDHESWFEIRALMSHLLDRKQTRVPIRMFDIKEETGQAIRYIVEVANGLHSMVTGDKQILGQFKDAFRLSQSNRMISGRLERIFQLAMRTHKRISNETGYHQGSTSMSHLAIKEIRQRTANDHIPVLVIGAGQIAADLMKYLAGRAYTNVTVMNRTTEKAKALASQYGFNSHEYNVDPSFLERFEVIISCAASAGIIPFHTQASIRNKLLIDLTSSQSIPKTAGTSNQLVTLDDLGLRKDADGHRRLIEIAKARSVLSHEHAAFLDWLQETEKRKQKNLMTA